MPARRRQPAPTPTRTDHVLRSHTLVHYLARLRAGGVDPTALLARFGLTPALAEQPEVELPLTTFQALSDAIAEELPDPFMGLNLARAIPPAAWGVIELSARSAPSFRAGAQRLVRYIGLRNDFEVFSLDAGPREAAVDHRIPGVPLALGRHGNEQLLALITRVIREVLLEPSWAPTRVSFAHPAPEDVEPLRAFFRTRVLEFGLGHNALHFPLSTLELPVATADAALLQVLDAQAHRALGEHAPPGDALARVKDRIRHDLQDGAPSLEKVASGLKMSARTLQRRLGAHDLQFSALVDETRRELAEDHLAHSNLALAEVAFVLGYADLATFIRAFKRWTGQTPKAFRERAQRGG